MAASATRSYTPLERTLSLAAVIIGAFGVGVAFGVGFPLTALTLETWGEPKWVIGIAGAAPAIATVMIMPLAPRIISRLGAVWTITLGCALASGGFLALGLLSDAWSWIGVRLLMCAGLSLPWLVGETWINLVTREEMRARVLSLYAIAYFAGFAVGPTALKLLGTVGAAPFIAGALGTLFAGLPVVLARRLAPSVEFDHTPNIVAVLRLSPIAFAASFIGGFSEITYLSLIPNVGLAAGLDADAALKLLTLLTVGGLCLQFPLGWLADKFSRMALLGVLAVAFILLSLLLPSAFGRGIAAEVVICLIGGVILAFYMIGLAILGERVPAQQLAAANAGYIIMYQSGAIVGPVAAGAAMTFAPVTGFILTVTGLMAISGLVLWLLHRRNAR